MRKATTLTAIVLLLICTVYFSCRKINDVAASTPDNAAAYKEFAAITKQINDAKEFFENNIDTTVTQKFKKTALWDKAYIASYKSGDKIVVPLQYDKNYMFISSFAQSHKLSLQKQSHLYVYKNAEGNYKAEIVTEMPAESNFDKGAKAYSGFIQISDWSDKIIKSYHYINGKISDEKNHSTNPTALPFFAAAPPTK
jgi:hypothetical protein